MRPLSKKLIYPLAVLAIPAVIFGVLFAQGWGEVKAANLRTQQKSERQDQKQKAGVPTNVDLSFLKRTRTKGVQLKRRIPILALRGTTPAQLVQVCALLKAL